MSKSNIKALTAFCFAENFAHMVITQSDNQPVVKMAKELKSLTNKAIKAFPDPTQKQIDDMDKRLKYNLSPYEGKPVEAVVQISMVLAQFDEPEQRIKTPWKLKHIKAITNKLLEMYEYLLTIMKTPLSEEEIGKRAEKTFNDYHS